MIRTFRFEPQVISFIDKSLICQIRKLADNGTDLTLAVLSATFLERNLPTILDVNIELIDGHLQNILQARSQTITTHR